MASAFDRAAKIRELYLGLADTEETPTWGSPHFRVAGKIFGGLGEEAGVTTIGLKLEMEHADAMVASDPRFTRARYVGHKGWVSIDVSQVENWEEIRQLVLESYRLIAPKRTFAKLVASSAASVKQPVSAAERAVKRTPESTSKSRKAPAKRAVRAAKVVRPTKQAPAKGAAKLRKAPTKQALLAATKTSASKPRKAAPAKKAARQMPKAATKRAAKSR